MKLSIITPAYNSAAFIEKCLMSVAQQDYLDIEHVVMDSASKDTTVDILKKYDSKYNLKWVSEKDRGIADAMNKGFAKATGEIYAWVDADNYYYEGIASYVMDIFKKNESIDIVYGNIAIGVDEDHKRIYRPPNNIDFAKSLIQTTGAIPAQPGVFFRKSLYEKTGGFDISYRVAGDYEFWVHALSTNPKLLYVDKTFGFYKLELGAASQSFKGVYRGYKEMATIGKKYGQPLRGKIALAIKYARGFIVKMIRKNP